MDIKEFYLSITEETLVFAQTNTNISNDDTRIIEHTRNSLLFHNRDTWKKKS